MRQLDNKHSGHISQLPKITLITCGYKEIEQTYENIDHVILEDVTPPEAFNEGIKSSNNSIYCFLDYNSDFASKTVVEDAVDIFLKYPEFGGIYTDNILNGNRQYYPSYSYLTLQNVVINTPFFGRQELNIEFDQHPSLYYYETLKKIGQYAILHHIPEALFTIQGKSNV